MQCNGKCHLKKELKKAADDESQNKSQIKQFDQEELFYRNIVFLNKIEITTGTNSHFLYINKDTSFLLEHITPPPQIS